MQNASKMRINSFSAYFMQNASKTHVFLIYAECKLNAFSTFSFYTNLSGAIISNSPNQCLDFTMRFSFDLPTPMNRIERAGESHDPPHSDEGSSSNFAQLSQYITRTPGQDGNTELPWCKLPVDLVGCLNFFSQSSQSFFDWEKNISEKLMYSEVSLT